MRIALKKVTAPGMPLWERILAKAINWGTGRRGYFHCELQFGPESFTADPELGVVLWRHPWAANTWTFYDIGHDFEPQIWAWCERQVREHEGYSVYDAASCSPLFRRLFGWWGRLKFELFKSSRWYRHHHAHEYCSLVVKTAIRPWGFVPSIAWNARKVPPNLIQLACERAGYRRSDS